MCHGYKLDNLKKTKGDPFYDSFFMKHRVDRITVNLRGI